MGRAKPKKKKKKKKVSFEHAQNGQIQINPAHVQSLNRAFALHWYIPLILLAKAKSLICARMRRLIRAFVVRICPNTCFHMARTIYEGKTGLHPDQPFCGTWFGITLFVQVCLSEKSEGK